MTDIKKFNYIIDSIMRNENIHLKRQYATIAKLHAFLCRIYITVGTNLDSRNQKFTDLTRKNKGHSEIE